jgi:hypothetical protein
MAHYDDNGTVADLVRAREGAVSPDPGKVLEEAINLWCYFLKLEGDPLAYRCEFPRESGCGDPLRGAERHPLGAAG